MKELELFIENSRLMFVFLFFSGVFFGVIAQRIVDNRPVAPAFNPSTQYAILPVNVYYKCQDNHFYANNIVTITISSQSITFEDKQRGIDKEAFFTVTYFTD